MLCGAKHLILARLYSGTPLPMSQRSLAILMGWPYYRGRLKFHDLSQGPIMTNTPYIAFAFLEQLLYVINKQSECRYRVQ